MYGILSLTPIHYFLCCHFQVVITNVKTVETTEATLILFYGFHFLSNINSLINPFIYAIFNKSIRSGDAKTNNSSKDSKSLSFLRSLGIGRQKSTITVGNDPPSVYRNKANKYDFTKQSKGISSVSTQKFQMSDKGDDVIIINGSPMSSTTA
jgi:hypothetical protein